MSIGKEEDGWFFLDAVLAQQAIRLEDRLIRTISDLVRIPSENTPPYGSELACQQYVYQRLGELNLAAKMYDLGEVAGLIKHPGFWPDREYANRPNTSGVWRGTGGGRSLLLSGHIDTVPRGTEAWERDPFGAQIEGNRLYGLGANDMKGGIGAALLAIEVLQTLGLRLRGDLSMETVVDEEFGGVNGTLAARLSDHTAQAAIICEPTQLMICPAQTGGRIAHITLQGSGGGILDDGIKQIRVTEQLHFFLGEVEEFAGRGRLTAPVHAFYSDSSDPVPVWVTKISCGGWGPHEPITLPVKCRIELYWQAMPGEAQEKIDEEFHRWLAEVIAKRPDLFAVKPEVSFPIRWLPGSALEGEQPLVSGLRDALQSVTSLPAQVRGIPGPCDMYVFHQHFNIPAVLFGPVGGNTHAPDEWVDLDSALVTVQSLTRFICRWCDVDWEQSGPNH
ncbi:MAG: M20/M25/M40 family metallo-hydrolase [Pyrinomonadaceae bacterium]